MNNNTVTFIKLKEVFQELWNKVKENFVTEVKYDSNDKKLKYTKNGQDTEITSVITKWKDLEHTEEYNLKNIFDKNTQVIDGKKFSFTSITDDPNCSIIKIPCKAGDEFTIIKSATHDSSQVGIYSNTDAFLQKVEARYQTINNKVVYQLTIPNNLNDVAYFVNTMYKNQTAVSEVMVFEGNIPSNNIPTTYIPFIDMASILIDSSEVALSFDTTGTNLTSVTVHSAIKELNKKIVNSGGGTVTRVNGQDPNPQGEVTIGINDISGLQGALNGKVNNSEVGNGRNQIPRINGNGRLDESIMPDIAITDVIVIQNISDLMTQNVQTGDVVVVQSVGNKTFMCKNPSGQTQDTKFIEINMGYPVVKEVNNQRPNQTGALSLNATHINATIDRSTKTVEQHLSEIGIELRRTSNQSNSYHSRINALETRRNDSQIGEIISVFTNNSADYVVGGTTFLYIGVGNKVVRRVDYPQLADTLGLSTATNFSLPVINDTETIFNNGTRVKRKHFICAKKAY